MFFSYDPKNVNPDGNFFEELYHKEHFTILRVNAKRLINPNANKSGNKSELLITNYPV